MQSTFARGRSVESRAVQYLMSRGLRVLERNVYFRVGEIDLILEDPERKELVFVEVRSRVSPYGRERPIESLGYGKFYRLQKAVSLYLARMPSPARKLYSGIRIDLLGWDGRAWEWTRDLRAE